MGDLEAFLTGHPLNLAPLLLGAIVEHDGVRVRITEVEAYGGVGEDPGSHAFRGKTPRNEVMFGPPGFLYTYFTYGMHWCANVVVHDSDGAGAILLRAGEVVEGVDRARRGRPLAEHRIASGPARLATALAFSRVHNGLDLSGHFFLPSHQVPAATSPRTGVSGAGADRPWRFFIPGEKSVSPYRPAKSRPRSQNPLN
jgi:DNA-3-methyladenine glycosylase